MQAELELVSQAAPYVDAAHPRISGDLFYAFEKFPELTRSYEAIGGRSRNSEIGKAIKRFYNLTNDGDNRENHPISSLIKSHQIFIAP